MSNLPQRGLQSVYIRHPWPLTSHRIRKNSQKTDTNLSQGEKGRNLHESNRGGSFSRMDRSNRCHVTRRNHYRVTTHSMWMTECIIVGRSVLLRPLNGPVKRCDLFNDPWMCLNADERVSMYCSVIIPNSKTSDINLILVNRHFSIQSTSRWARV